MNLLKLTGTEWVNYLTWLYLSGLCVYPVCMLLCVKENNIESFSYILIYDLIKIPLVNFQSSFLSVSVMTSLQLCPFFTPNEVPCVINKLCVCVCVWNWNGYAINICFKRDPTFHFISWVILLMQKSSFFSFSL